MNGIRNDIQIKKSQVNYDEDGEIQNILFNITDTRVDTINEKLIGHKYEMEVNFDYGWGMRISIEDSLNDEDSYGSSIDSMSLECLKEITLRLNIIQELIDKGTLEQEIGRI